MLDAAFADIARGFSDALGGPFHAAKVYGSTAPIYDDGGSIATPGTPSERDAMVQGDAVTEAMRQAEGYRDKDIRLVVIDLTGTLDTEATIDILAGPHQGQWSVQSVDRDPLGLGWVCRGRRA